MFFFISDKSVFSESVIVALKFEDLYLQGK